MKKLFVVGIGPGNAPGLTAEAQSVLEHCDVLCGYSVYIDLLRPQFPQKEMLASPMMKEVERCLLALQAASDGKTVALVCSGDAGVYGMASPVLELAVEYPQVEVVIIPGVTAAQSGAALLGAPLDHDYAVISLSDLLTPWEVIEKRLDAAASADFSLCLYNPRSKKRAEHLAKACDILLRHKSPDTRCGWVRNIGRDGCEKGLLTLQELRNFEADMFSTLYVGNSHTKVVQGFLVAPRGYRGIA